MGRDKEEGENGSVYRTETGRKRKKDSLCSVCGGGGLKFLFSVFYTTLYIVYVVCQDDAMP